MTSTRTAARAALAQTLREFMPERTWLEANSAEPEDAPEDGTPLLLLRDGEPDLDGEPTLGVRSWPWADVVSLEVHARLDSAGEAAELVDTVLAEVEAALADRQLGGAVDGLEVGQPQPVLTDEIGVSPLLAAVLPITLYYTTAAASG